MNQCWYYARLKFTVRTVLQKCVLQKFDYSVVWNIIHITAGPFLVIRSSLVLPSISGTVLDGGHRIYIDWYPSHGRWWDTADSLRHALHIAIRPLRHTVMQLPVSVGN